MKLSDTPDWFMKCPVPDPCDLVCLFESVDLIDLRGNGTGRGRHDSETIALMRTFVADGTIKELRDRWGQLHWYMTPEQREAWIAKCRAENAEFDAEFVPTAVSPPGGKFQTINYKPPVTGWDSRYTVDR